MSTPALTVSSHETDWPRRPSWLRLECGAWHRYPEHLFSCMPSYNRAKRCPPRRAADVPASRAGSRGGLKLQVHPFLFDSTTRATSARGVPCETALRNALLPRSSPRPIAEYASRSLWRATPADGSFDRTDVCDECDVARANAPHRHDRHFPSRWNERRTAARGDDPRRVTQASETPDQFVTTPWRVSGAL